MIPDQIEQCFAHNHNNLLKWIKTNKKGGEEYINLKDYDYYPAINLKTDQMAFLRMHTTRITFMKTSFNAPSGYGVKIHMNCTKYLIFEHTRVHKNQYP